MLSRTRTSRARTRPGRFSRQQWNGCRRRAYLKNHPREWSRRSLLSGMGGLAFASPGANKIRLGGPIFLKRDDPRELAREHKRLGYSAALCPRAKADDSTRVREIEKAFAAEDVVIAEVGAWTNMLDPDAAKRRANMQYVSERLA